MKQTSTTKTSATSESQDDAPKLTQADFDRAKFRVGGKDATRAQWQAAVQTSTQMGLAKRRISIMLDEPIIAHFKSAAGERGYQTLINDTLRRVVEGEHFVVDMRAAIRQELAAVVARPAGA